VAIDLNSDVGESFGRWQLGDDEAMLAVVNSANVACGFHAGDPTTIASTVSFAASQGVRVGAQVAYRDLAGFGRRFLDVSRTDLTNDVVYQIGALDALAKAAGTKVSYVKPHGALYNAVYTHSEHAAALIDAICSVDPGLPVLGLAGSALLQRASDRGIRTFREGFADRSYQRDGQLVPRTAPGAVLDEDSAVEQGLRLASDPTIDSICVHGDSPGAVQMAVRLRAQLLAAGHELASFV
jgi:5-oxoprolinase (ATP-hydrolysing) subunit A